jgi:hypothetical protein
MTFEPEDIWRRDIWDAKDNFEIYFRTHCESDQGGSGFNAYEGFSLGCDTDGHD